MMTGVSSLLIIAASIQYLLKIALLFFGHVERMENDRIAKRIGCTRDGLIP